MHIDVFTTTRPTASAAAQDLRAQIEQTGARVGDAGPDFVALHGSELYDLAQLRDGLRLGGDVALHGATSCKGVMSHATQPAGHDQSFGVFAIWDPEGDYGTAARALGEAAREQAAAAAEAALAQAGRDGEVPDLVWLSVTPGQEEAVLQGIRDVIGDDAPIVGGSAADNSVAGNWSVFDAEDILNDGVTVSVLFLSGHQTNAFQSGYSPTPQTGRITRGAGRRIHEIDGRPAAEVYEAWTGGALRACGAGDESQNILAGSTHFPLARQILRRDGESDYLLIHPAAIHPDGSIDVFADVREGEELIQMTGTREALVDRAGQVAGLSLSALGSERVEPSGALVVYCGGCRMAVEDDINQVAQNLRTALPDMPFLGVFTFGEQGHLPSGGNCHGNLMISCITFGT